MEGGGTVFEKRSVASPSIETAYRPYLQRVDWRLEYCRIMPVRSSVFLLLILVILGAVVPDYLSPLRFKVAGTALDRCRPCFVRVATPIVRKRSTSRSADI